jgi:23S rRNA (guanosine2251-2'-O)-methyltransferase
MAKKLSMETLERISEVAYKDKPKSGISILLDDVRSMANVGSIFRTADCLGIDHIYICGISPVPPHREIEKTALGATLSVPWTYHENVIELAEKLKSEQHILCAIEQVEGSINLLEFRPNSDQNHTYILGNEVFGVKEELIDLSEVVLEIPQFGSKHSFNVSITAAIVLWDHYSKTIGKVLK